MSFDALAWAAKQRPGKLASKMALLALANYADEQGCAYPSTAAIAAFGDMDHKTATAALDHLANLGLIADTGRRAGHTKQIKVYRLALERAPETEAYQKRKPPASAVKAPQKRGTDTVREPVISVPPERPAVPPALGLRGNIFSAGLRVMIALGVPEREARSMLGKWRKNFGDAATFDAVCTAEAEAPSDPIPFISRVLETRHGKTRNHARSSAEPGVGRTTAAAQTVLAHIAARRSRSAPPTG
ncbi:hypothetical protein GVO57_09325 [Sphingomonas changnyeongensis]|uniref:Helix-turn-helix domain-containing protein n=1 Tax=Sphingomonas changnyeongensis TaxID=2698679 RepID=A0A7Z2NWF0_9SPHN|nr:hypothetical protein [Sphingomonas changnyeongensis]QHL90982.1 hypothetical protein GVO57_09325 [Sphingomonas changnyeongensis]